MILNQQRSVGIGMFGRNIPQCLEKPTAYYVSIRIRENESFGIRNRVGLRRSCLLCYVRIDITGVKARRKHTNSSGGAHFGVIGHSYPNLRRKRKLSIGIDIKGKRIIRYLKKTIGSQSGCLHSLLTLVYFANTTRVTWTCTIETRKYSRGLRTLQDAS